MQMVTQPTTSNFLMSLATSSHHHHHIHQSLSQHHPHLTPTTTLTSLPPSLPPSLIESSLTLTPTLTPPSLPPSFIESSPLRSAISGVQSLSRRTRHLRRPLGHRRVARRRKMPQRPSKAVGSDELLGVGPPRCGHARPPQSPLPRDLLAPGHWPQTHGDW